MQTFGVAAVTAIEATASVYIQSLVAEPIKLQFITKESFDAIINLMVAVIVVAW